MFNVASFDDIKHGKVTDVYFVRTLEILKNKGVDKWVRAEFIVKRLPGNVPWAVFTGLGEISKLVKGLNVKVRAIREGTIIKPYQPVLEIEGMYTDFAVLETAILGLMCESSGVATKAARCKKAAGNKPVISFGARRVHPVIAPMVEMSAYMGGCDGVSVVFDAERLGVEPSGTMPHALILVMGDTVDATQAFYETYGENIRLVALIDTFNDEKIEAIRVAEAFKDKLYAVRLDTPSTRRGDFVKILEEVRWELNLRGFSHVKIFVSGGIDENSILQLNPYVDLYGVGTTISNARVIDFAMDIIEIEGKPLAKRGKMSGAKRVLKCSACSRDKVVPLNQDTDSRCDCGGLYTDILVPWYDGKNFLFGDEPAKDVRQYLVDQLKTVEL